MTCRRQLCGQRSPQQDRRWDLSRRRNLPCASLQAPAATWRHRSARATAPNCVMFPSRHRQEAQRTLSELVNTMRLISFALTTSLAMPTRACTERRCQLSAETCLRRNVALTEEGWVHHDELLDSAREAVLVERRHALRTGSVKEPSLVDMETNVHHPSSRVRVPLPFRS